MLFFDTPVAVVSAFAISLGSRSRKSTLQRKRAARVLTLAHPRTTADNAKTPRVSSGQCLPLEQ
ncbi:hypothetical protein LC55x_0559 [Lysobacter capsici]|nr:hypothetical protein LC55x_0559 [Lysobacter capsici]